MADAPVMFGRVRDVLNPLLALYLLATGAAAIVVPVPEIPVVFALLAVALLNRRGLNRPAWIIGGLVFVLFLWGWAGGWIAETGGLDRMIFLSAFLVALGLLSRAASRAPDIRKAAAVVASRPRGARYLFVTLGTHIFGIFLNFGAASLMATLLAQTRETLERQNAVEDLTLSMLRGFGAMPMWSPLALSTIITLSILPEVDYFQILPYGLAAAVLYLGAGYAASRGPRATDPDPGKSPMTRALPALPEQLILLRVVARVALLVAVAFVLHVAADLSMPASVLVAVLGFSLAWWAIQVAARIAPGLHRELAATAASGVNEIVIVSCAGFLGAIIAWFVSSFDGALPSPPDALVPALIALVPLGMVLGGVSALNPIVSASILLGVLHPLVPEPALMWLALAAIVGWGLTAGSTPFTANVLITTRIMQLEPAPLLRRGNLKLTVLSLTALGLFLAVGTVISLQG
ncbi:MULTISPECIES: hypothetical protein [unclassified Roseovarius]|uniref:hypothetical protein n=1 Tax=unclassified Roseovarius TaxID=2614913 RepID=UPI00273F3119|nr:hypothetical protein [Roseovarius sp. MMSF_3350]